VIGRDTPTRPGFEGVKYKPTAGRVAALHRVRISLFFVATSELLLGADARR